MAPRFSSFPEGTRSKTGELLRFKKGAFILAKEWGLPILPVTIKGTRDLSPPGTTDMMPGQAELIIHPPIPASSYADLTTRDLMKMSRGANWVGFSLILSKYPIKKRRPKYLGLRFFICTFFIYIKSKLLGLGLINLISVAKQANDCT